MSHLESGDVRYGRYSLVPRDVPRIETPYRRITTPLPVPESVETFQRLQAAEPRSMNCQPPVLWDHASGATVCDRFGNRWIDWSSCVLVANVGHGHPRIAERIRRLLDRGHLATYVFAHEERVDLAEASFRAALALQPNLELDTVRTSPRVLEAFNRAKQPVED